MFGIPFSRPFTNPFGIPFLGGLGGTPLPPFPNGAVGYYNAYDITNLGFSSANNVNLVADQASVTYGDEELTNGDFSDGATDWLNGQATFNDDCHFDNTANNTSNCFIQQNSVVETGLKYLCTFTVVSYIEGSLSIIGFGNSYNLNITGIGTYSAVVTASQNNFVLQRAINGVDCDITVDNISVKEILTGTNDLTQGVAGANPVFIEHDTVTQFTASNQPTFDYDKVVTQDTLADEPTLIDTGGGVLAIEFGSGESLIGLDPQLVAFTYEFESDISETSTLFSSTATNARSIITQTTMRLVADSGITYQVSSSNSFSASIFKYVKDGNNLTMYQDGVQLGSALDVTGDSFTINSLGASLPIAVGNLKAFRQWNSAISTGTPDFELLPDPTTMRKDDGSQPSVGDSISGWKATGAELAVGFDGDYLSGIPSQESNFCIEVDFKPSYLTSRVLLTQSEISTNSRLRLNPDGQVDLLSTTGGLRIVLPVSSITVDTRNQIKIELTATEILTYLNGSLVTTLDRLGYEYLFTQVAYWTASNNRFLGDMYSFRQWNSADSSGTPDFELLPTVEACNTAIGGAVERWNATSHRGFKNRLVFDPNDTLIGLPTQASDFSYMAKLSFDVLSSSEYIFSDSSGNSALFLLADNFLYLRDTTGANDIALTGYSVVADEHVFIITREGNSLKYYVDSILKQTVDVTGRTFTFDSFGASADSMQDAVDDWGVWDRALTQEDINYFSYLRSDDTGEILLPPLLPS